MSIFVILVIVVLVTVVLSPLQGGVPILVIWYECVALAIIFINEWRSLLSTIVISMLASISKKALFGMVVVGLGFVTTFINFSIIHYFFIVCCISVESLFNRYQLW